MRTIHRLGALGLALWLAGCGSDDGGPPPAAANEVPQSALVSGEAFTRFVGSLPPSDTGEALVLNDLQPPVSDTAEPAPVS